jgi:hypothetical protein
LIAFGFGIGSSFESSNGVSYIQYLLPGIIGMTLLMSSTMSGLSLIWDKKFGFLKETLCCSSFKGTTFIWKSFRRSYNEHFSRNFCFDFLVSLLDSELKIGFCFFRFDCNVWSFFTF